MEVVAEGGKGIITLAQPKLLLHRDQLWWAFGTGDIREGRGKEQRNVSDVVIRRGRNEAEVWLVDMLKFTKLGELTTYGRAQLDGVGWKVVRAMLPDERAQFPSSRISVMRFDEQNRNLLLLLKVQPEEKKLRARAAIRPP